MNVGLGLSIAIAVYLVSQAAQPKHIRINNWSIVVSAIAFCGVLLFRFWLEPILVTLALGVTFGFYAFVVEGVSSSAKDMKYYNYLRSAFWVSFSLILSVAMELVFPGQQSMFLGMFSMFLLVVTIDLNPEELTWGDKLNWYSFAVSICAASIIFWGRTI